MAMYFQRARLAVQDTIGVDQQIRFDIPIRSSQTLPYIEDLTTPAVPEDDFAYHDDGSIDIFRGSTYIVAWNIATLTGMATTGQTFELRKRDYDAELLNPTVGEIWTPVSQGTAAYQLSASQGNAVLLVSELEILAHGRATVALFNAADAPVKLSHHPHQKAGIVLFGIGPVDSDISNLYNYVQDLYSFVSYSDVFIFNASSAPFYNTTVAGSPAGAQVPLNQSPHTNNYQVGVIWSGYTYNFWLISPTNNASMTINGNKHMILDAEHFIDDKGRTPLKSYQGQTTFGSLWLLENGSYKLYPVMLDNTGIYIQIGSQTNGVANAKFTQTLILIPPAEENPMPAPPIG